MGHVWYVDAWPSPRFGVPYNIPPWGYREGCASIEPRRPTMAESHFGSAEGHLPHAATVPGSHRAGPCGLGGAPYGRTECGRARGARGRNPRRGKGKAKGVNPRGHAVVAGGSHASSPELLFTLLRRWTSHFTKPTASAQHMPGALWTGRYGLYARATAQATCGVTQHMHFTHRVSVRVIAVSAARTSRMMSTLRRCRDGAQRGRRHARSHVRCRPAPRGAPRPESPRIES